MRRINVSAPMSLRGAAISEHGRLSRCAISVIHTNEDEPLRWYRSRLMNSVIEDKHWWIMQFIMCQTCIGRIYNGRSQSTCILLIIKVTNHRRYSDNPIKPCRHKSYDNMIFLTACGSNYWFSLVLTIYTTKFWLLIAQNPFKVATIIYNNKLAFWPVSAKWNTKNIVIYYVFLPKRIVVVLYSYVINK